MRLACALDGALPDDDRIGPRPGGGIRLRGGFRQRPALGPERRRGVARKLRRTRRGLDVDLVVRFAGRSIPMRYAITSYREPNVVVLESRLPRFTSRDTISVAPAATG